MGSHDVQEFCLKWNNHHSTLISVLDSLLIRESLVDVVLAAEGKFIKVHRFVLFACSNYFQDLLSQQLDKHAVVFMKDVRYTDLKALVDFMYKGEVNISQYQLESFLQTAEALQIKGLADKPNQRKYVSNLVTNNKSSFERKPKSSSSATAASSATEHNQNNASHSKQIEPQSSSSPAKVVIRPSRAKKRPAPTPVEEVQEDEGEEMEQEETKVPEQEIEMNQNRDADDGDPSDQESIPEEDEASSVGQSHHSFEDNSTSDYPSAVPSVHEHGNETWASENGGGNTSENNCDLTMSDSSLGGDGASGDGAGNMVIEDLLNGGERPFSCPRCGRRYKRKNNAVAHLRYECGVVPSFPCPVCSHMLSQRRYIQKHIRRKHPEYIQEYEEQKKYRNDDE